jgi:hypothetical protein
MASSLVSIVAPSVAGLLDFFGFGRDDLVENGASIPAFSQDPTEPLLGLPSRAFASEDHGDFDFGQVDPFIEYLVGYQGWIDSVAKPFEIVESLGFSAMAQQTRDKKSQRYFASHGVRTGEDDHRLAQMKPKQIFEHLELFVGPILNGFLLSIQSHDAGSFAPFGRLIAQVFPFKQGVLLPAFVDVTCNQT